MTVPTFVQPDRTTQSGSAYPANLDAAIAVLANTAAHFAPHEASTPNMTVVVDAGKLGDLGQGTVTVGQQTTGTITAPSTNPRIDRVVIDGVTGAVSVVTGTEAASPVAPAVPVGKITVAQVALSTSTTSITNSLLTDERTLFRTDIPSPGYLKNVSFTSTVASNALTCALKGQDGNDPSINNPVHVAFRSTSLTTAAPVLRVLTAAMSVVLPQGGTDGFVINTIGTFTVTIASPAVVTLSNHGLVDGQMVRLATTGALPTGLAVATDYFVKYINSSTFNLAATLGGSNINTSGSQSGVHTLTSGEIGYIYKYLVDDGSTQALGIIKKAILDESLLHNTTAIGTGSDSDNVLYTTSAMSNAAVRLIGRSLIQAGMNAAGDWPNAPTRREVWSPTTGRTVSDIIFDKSGVSTSSLNPLPTSGTINLEVGDLVAITYSYEADRNGADFGVIKTFGINGTAVLEANAGGVSGSAFNFKFDGIAAYGAGTIYGSETIIKKVVNAGTVTSFSSGNAFYGTTPINLKSSIRITITRPNY